MNIDHAIDFADIISGKQRQAIEGRPPGAGTALIDP
jgi:hypothetical protein